MIKPEKTDNPQESPPDEAAPARSPAPPARPTEKGGDRPPPSEESKKADESDRPKTRPWSTGWVIGLSAAVLLVLLIGLAISITVRVIHKHHLAEETAQKANAPPRVHVVVARRGSKSSLEALPGSSQAFFETAIYARTNGYLKTLLVDIGDKVKADQLLAEISAPEINAQLEQSQATVLQSKGTLESNIASEAFSKSDLARYTFLRKPGAATQQDYENRLMTERNNVAQIHVTQATITSNQATVKQLSTMVSYQKLLAPFDGVVTARNANPGDLITADNPSNERQLFHLAKIDPLRVFVDVPQSLSTVVRVGLNAVLFRTEEPQRHYQGKVTRTASALSPTTRTLRTEVDVPNAAGALLPGMYLQVKFIIDRESIPLIVPTDAVIVRSASPKVAVLDKRQQVRYRTVQLGRDYGKTIEVLTGLHAGEPVIVHPGDDLEEGIVVQPIQPGEERKGQTHEHQKAAGGKEKSASQNEEKQKPGKQDQTGAKQGEREEDSQGAQRDQGSSQGEDERKGADDASRRGELDQGQKEGLKPQESSGNKGKKKRDSD